MDRGSHPQRFIPAIPWRSSHVVWSASPGGLCSQAGNKGELHLFATELNLRRDDVLADLGMRLEGGEAHATRAQATPPAWCRLVEPDPGSIHPLAYTMHRRRNVCTNDFDMASPASILSKPSVAGGAGQRTPPPLPDDPRPALEPLPKTSGRLSNVQIILALIDENKREVTAAARSQFEDTGPALSLCAAGATAMGATGPIAATGTVPVRRQWARLRSVPLRRGPTTAAAVAMTPTATGFAHRIERRDAVGLCKEPKASCDGAGDGAVVHVE